MGKGGCSPRARCLTQRSRSGRAASAGSPKPEKGGVVPPCHNPLPRPGNALLRVLSNFWQLGLDGEGATGGGPGSQQRLCHAKPPSQRGRRIPTWLEAPSGGWRHPGASPAPKGWGGQPDPTSRHGTHSRAWSRGDPVAVPQFTHLHPSRGGARVTNASLGLMVCRWLLEGFGCPGHPVGSGVQLGTLVCRPKPPREKGSTHKPASGLFLTKSHSNFPWRGASSARGAGTAPAG